VGIGVAIATLIGCFVDETFIVEDNFDSLCELRKLGDMPKEGRFISHEALVSFGAAVVVRRSETSRNGFRVLIYKLPRCHAAARPTAHYAPTSRTPCGWQK
jgi:hypothetical protein